MSEPSDRALFNIYFKKLQDGESGEAARRALYNAGKEAGRREAEAEIERLERLIKIKDRQFKAGTAYWVRASLKALSGDTVELANRVALATADPVDVVLSEPPPPEGEK